MFRIEYLTPKHATNTEKREKKVQFYWFFSYKVNVYFIFKIEIGFETNLIL